MHQLVLMSSEFVRRFGRNLCLCKVQIGDVSSISRNKMLMSVGYETLDED